MKLSPLLFVAVHLAQCLAGPAQNPAPERFAWGADLGAARETAAQEGKPLLIVFRCEP